MKMTNRKTTTKVIAMLLAVVLTCSVWVGSVCAATVSYKTDGTRYVITNVGGKKNLNVYGNSSANGVNVTLWEEDGTEYYKFQACGAGYLIVPECATKRCINIYTDKKAYNKANVTTWSITRDSTQIWIPEAVSGGVIFRSANNKSLVLTATGNKNGSNVNIQTYNSSNKYQVWTVKAYSAPKATTNKTTTSTTTNTATVKGKITTKQIQDVLKKYGYINSTGNNKWYWTPAKGKKNNEGFQATKNTSGNSYYYYGIQCYGFANFVMSKVTGTICYPGNNNKYGWKKIAANKVTELCVGDIVRTGPDNNGHSAVILSINEKGVFTVAECWGSYANEIHIGGKFNNSYNTLKQLKNAGLNYVYRYYG